MWVDVLTACLSVHYMHAVSTGLEPSASGDADGYGLLPCGSWVSWDSTYCP